MQGVLLAGGLGARLGHLTTDRPKCLIPICGRPFIEYQLELLKQHGISDIVICVGHLGEQVEKHLGNGRRFGVQIRYSHDGEGLLGTAGAVRNAEHLLGSEFFLIYGDSYLCFNYAAVAGHFRKRNKLALMVVYHNHNHLERSNVIVEDGLVKTYDKQRQLPNMDYINFGASVIRKDALALVPSGTPYSQEEWYRELIESKELLAYETKERFFEIGSPRGLEEFSQMMAGGNS